MSEEIFEAETQDQKILQARLQSYYKQHYGETRSAQQLWQELVPRLNIATLEAADANFEAEEFEPFEANRLVTTRKRFRAKALALVATLTLALAGLLLLLVATYRATTSPTLAAATSTPTPNVIKINATSLEYNATSSYIQRSEPDVTLSGLGSFYIKARVPKPVGYAVLTQKIQPGSFLGKRLRLSAFVKTQQLEEWAGLWLEFDSPGGNRLDLQDKPIQGTSAWKKQEMVLDVPKETTKIVFGLMSEGPGELWIDQIQLEEVGQNVPTSSKQPRNLNFEAGLFGWFLSTNTNYTDYERTSDHATRYNGDYSATLKGKASTDLPAKKFGTLMQVFRADNYLGKRVRFSAYVKTEAIENWAGLWMRVDDKADKSLFFDNMEERPIKGTNDWHKYEIVLDVPKDAANLFIGVLLDGKGQLWLDDAQVEIVGSNVPLTGKPTQ